MKFAKFLRIPFFNRPAVVAAFEDRVLSDRFNLKQMKESFFPKDTILCCIQRE